MHRIAGLIVLLLLAASLATAAETKKTAATKPAGTLTKLDAEEVFAFVEQVTKDPKIDRAKALAFLQRGLDGQIRRLDVEVAESGSTVCIAKKCKTKLCKRCSLETFSCGCSNCCLAVQP